MVSARISNPEVDRWIAYQKWGFHVFSRKDSSSRHMLPFPSTCSKVTIRRSYTKYPFYTMYPPCNTSPISYHVSQNNPGASRAMVFVALQQPPARGITIVGTKRAHRAWPGYSVNTFILSPPLPAWRSPLLFQRDA